MGDFDGIKDAKVNAGGNYVLPGQYPLLFINACKKITSQENGDKVFIVELDILDSLVEGRPKGMSMSWIVKLKHQPALGNIKGFLAEAMNVNVDNVDSAGADFAVSAENPLHGRLIRCDATDTITKKARKPFTKCKWSAISAETQEKAAELHKAAGFSPAA